jgi:hypothetical protein
MGEQSFAQRERRPFRIKRFPPSGELETYDDFIADDQGGGGPPSGLLSQLFQILGILDDILFDERNPFLREKLPRRLTGVSGRVKINDNRLSH